MVYGEGNSSSAVKALESAALVCLTPDGYEKLSKNMAEVERYIRQLKSLVERYEQERRGQ